MNIENDNSDTGCLDRLRNLFKTKSTHKNSVVLLETENKQVKTQKINLAARLISDRRISMVNVVKRTNETDEEFESRKMEVKNLTNDSGYSDEYFIDIVVTPPPDEIKTKTDPYSSTEDILSSDDENEIDDVVFPLPRRKTTLNRPDLNELIRQLDEETLRLNQLYVEKDVNGKSSVYTTLNGTGDKIFKARSFEKRQPLIMSYGNFRNDRINCAISPNTFGENDMTEKVIFIFFNLIIDLIIKTPARLTYNYLKLILYFCFKLFLN